MFFGCLPCCGGGCETHFERFGGRPGLQVTSWSVSDSISAFTRFFYDAQGNQYASQFSPAMSNYSGSSVSARITAEGILDVLVSAGTFADSIGFFNYSGWSVNFREYTCHEFANPGTAFAGFIRNDELNNLSVRYTQSSGSTFETRQGIVTQVNGGASTFTPSPQPHQGAFFYVCPGNLDSVTTGGSLGSFAWRHDQTNVYTVPPLAPGQPVIDNPIARTISIEIEDVVISGTNQSVGLFRASPGSFSPTLYSA